MKTNSIDSSYDQNQKSYITSFHESVFQFSKPKKNSSFMTILMTTNTMTMTAILILPLLYSSYGIISCSLVICVFAYIQYKTCSLVLTHFDGKEDDLSLIISRIMGLRWKLAFNIAILVIQLSVVLIYYLLACNVIFPIVVSFIGHNYSKDKSHIIFTKFSFQYAALIATFITVLSINIKNISLIIKLGNVGFITLLVFFAFIIYTTINNFCGADSKSSFANELNIINPNIIYIAGTSSMSFLVHTTVPAIFKESKNQSNNQRDLKISYLIAVLLNILFGLFGYLGIFKNKVQNGTTANTVMDYYTGVYTIIVCFLFIAKLSTGIPIIFYIACQQLFAIINKNKEDKSPNLVQRQLFNIGVIAVLTGCGIVNLDPTIAISISGALLGYIIGYVIPVLMHLKCIYGILPWEKQPENYSQMIDSETGILKNEYLPMHLSKETKCLLIDQNNTETSPKDEQINTQCFCRHEYVVKISRGWRYAYFIFILSIGLASIGAQFFQIAKEIKK